ncbi:MAG TPA: hypothetical protein VHO50_05355 [Bacteroidales bacterium]|nr:hypothetical protein [Bacteroidales bacterium]
MKIIRLLLCFLFCQATNAQDLIGNNCGEVKEYMRENHKQMSLSNTNNNNYRYLKYSDSSGSTTMLFFLDSDSLCNNIRIICDKNAKKDFVNEYNSKYKRVGENIWLDTKPDRKIRFELSDEEYSSTISIKAEK